MNASSGGITLLACLVAALAACRITEPTVGEPAPPQDEGPSVSDEGPSVADEPLMLTGDRPALIVDPTPESRAELERVVSDMLFGAEVTLSEDALTESSVLILERERIRRIGNPVLTGRDLGMPERFRLLATDTGCVLIHESNHARYELRHTDCIAEP